MLRIKKHILFILCLLIIYPVISSAQYSKLHIYLNVDGTHFTAGNDKIFKINNEYIYSPGVEAGIIYDITKNISINTGIYYVTGFYQYWDDSKEISIPLNIRLSKNLKTSVKGFINAGFYFGTFLEYYLYGPHHVINGETAYWQHIYIDEIFETFSTDLNINPGFEFELSRHFSIYLSTFYKYRILQAGAFVPLFNRSFYGVKAGILITFAKNKI